jgi:hypothetical protein
MLLEMTMTQDRSVAGSASKSPIGSILVLATSLWTIAFVALSSIASFPGSFGPVQYVEGNWLGIAVFTLRIVTIIAVLAAPIVGGLIGAMRLGPDKRIPWVWLLTAVAVYLVAVILLVFNPAFIPMV